MIICSWDKKTPYLIFRVLTSLWFLPIFRFPDRKYLSFLDDFLSTTYLMQGQKLIRTYSKPIKTFHFQGRMPLNLWTDSIKLDSFFSLSSLGERRWEFRPRFEQHASHAFGTFPQSLRRHDDGPRGDSGQSRFQWGLHPGPGCEGRRHPDVLVLQPIGILGQRGHGAPKRGSRRQQPRFRD